MPLILMTQEVSGKNSTGHLGPVVGQNRMCQILALPLPQAINLNPLGPASCTAGGGEGQVAKCCDDRKTRYGSQFCNLCNLTDVCLCFLYCKIEITEHLCRGSIMNVNKQIGLGPEP